MRPEPDYYAELQVSPDAEMEVIQAAYRRLAAKYHPDVAPSAGAVERMKLLNAAYEVLSNPEKREAYDRYRAGRQRQGHPAPGAPLRRPLPWWIPTLGVVIVALVFRLSPRLILVLVPLSLVLWLIWKRRAS